MTINWIQSDIDLNLWAHLFGKKIGNLNNSDILKLRIDALKQRSKLLKKIV